MRNLGREVADLKHTRPERSSPVLRLQIRSACGVENVIPIAGSSACQRHVDLGLNHMRTISVVCREEEALLSNASMPEGHARSRETSHWFEGDQYPHGK